MDLLALGVLIGLLAGVPHRRDRHRRRRLILRLAPNSAAGNVETVPASHVRPLLTVFLGWLWVMAGANLAAPLYAVYAGDFGFSGIVLTTVFATYAVTLVITLLLAGRLADRVGRRPVILAGLVVAAIALVLFTAASATWWLYAARALQGVAVGLISGPATAALVEIDPLRDRARPALLAGLAQAVGSGLGPLLSGCLAQWAPAPLHTPYLVGLAGIAVAAAFVWTLPDGVRSEEPWRVQWPRVPHAIRADFLRLGLTAGLVWASLALYLSVVPSYVAGLLSTANLALLGANSAVACFASAGAQVWTQRHGGDRHRWQAVGLALLAVGLIVLIAVALVAAPIAGVAQQVAVLTAAVRAVVQLTVVALALRGVFAAPVAVIGVVALMFGVATWTAAPPLDYARHARAVVVSCALGASVAIGVVVGLPTLTRDVRTLVAVSGIILGGTIAAATPRGRVGAADGMRARRDEIEAWLSIGASMHEAVRPISATSRSKRWCRHWTRRGPSGS